MRLAACLEMQLNWLQPLLTSACWEGLTLLLLDKLLARLEVLLGRKVRIEARGSFFLQCCCPILAGRAHCLSWEATLQLAKS